MLLVFLQLTWLVLVLDRVSASLTRMNQTIDAAHDMIQMRHEHLSGAQSHWTLRKADVIDDFRSYQMERKSGSRYYGLVTEDFFQGSCTQ